MDATLHRIETLPGDGRYAVTFRRADSGDQAVVVHVAQAEGADAEIAVADAGLPTGWARHTDAFALLAAAIRAMDAGCRAGATVSTLRDVEGGWDVGLGNVVLGAAGVPTCTADGDMDDVGGLWVCGTCDARAVYGVVG